MTSPIRLVSSRPPRGAERDTSEPRASVVDAAALFDFESPPLPARGESLLGVRLGDGARERGSVHVFSGEDAEGRRLDVHVLDPEASHLQRRAFQGNMETLRDMRGEVPGLLRVFAVDPERCACLTESLPIGDACDVGALQWAVEKRLQLFSEIVDIFRELHRRRIYVGTWWVGDVLLDDELRPVLAQVATRLVDDRTMLDVGVSAGAYVAPEVISGDAPDGRADVHVLGRLLMRLLTDRHPTNTVELLPALDDLGDQPAGLVRIIRKCTTSAARVRYASADELARELERYARGEEVGMSHHTAADADEVGGAARKAARPVARPARRQAPTPLWMSSLPSVAPKAPVDALASTPSSVRKRVKAGPRSARAADVETRENADARLLWIGGGSAAAAAGLLGAYMLAGSAAFMTVVGVLVPVATAFVAAGAPVPSRRPRLSRLALALVAALAVHVFDPVTPIADRGLRRALTSGNAYQRARALQALVATGSSDLSGLSLRQMDLRGREWAHLDLSGSELGGADLSGADLSGADLSGANLAGANLAGASLEGAFVDGLRGLGSATCDATTVPPEGWRCRDGKLEEGEASEKDLDEILD